MSCIKAYRLLHACIYACIWLSCFTSRLSMMIILAEAPIICLGCFVQIMSEVDGVHAGVYFIFFLTAVLRGRGCSTFPLYII